MTAIAPTDVCYRCGYDLREIVDQQPCPECGLLAERSRRVSDELRYTRPKWLRRMAWGIRLMLLALAVAVAFPFVFGALGGVELWDLRWIKSLPIMGRMAIFPMGGFVFGSIALWVGIYFLTGAEGYPPSDRDDRRRRVALRLTAFIPMIVVALCVIGLKRAYSGFRHDELLWWTNFFLMFLASAPLPLLLFYQLRCLAKRARSANLAEHCAIVGIGVTGAILYIGAVIIIFQNAERWGWGGNWTNSSKTSLLLSTACGVVAGLFILWSLFLLLRFSFAFSRVSKQLRGEWRRDDRSLASAQSS